MTGAAIAPVTTSGIILFSPSDTARALSVADDRGLFFRVAAPTNLEGQVIGTQLADQGFTRISIATGSGDDDRDLAADIAANVNAFGGAVTATVRIDNEIEAGRAVDELLAGDPEAVVITTSVTASTAALVRQLAARGKGPTVLPTYGTSANMNTELVVMLGAA